VCIEFKEPDFSLRRKIWETHVPPNVTVAPNVDWEKLALNYEISGGFIKNVSTM
jgi:ATP-dependent 26S proteasome regulatory subunit